MAALRERIAESGGCAASAEHPSVFWRLRARLPFNRYLLALVLPLVTAVLALGVEEAIGRSSRPVLWMALAVIVSGLNGGLKPALLATLVSFVLSEALLFDTRDGPELNLGHFVGLAAFVLLSLVVSMYDEKVRRLLTSQEECSKRQAELQQAVLDRDDFVGFVSHELKGPASIILGDASVLGERLRELPPAQVADLIADIGTASERMLDLLENLLLLAKTDRGAVEKYEVPVRPILARVVARHSLGHPERRLISRYEDRDAVAVANIELLELLVGNLVDNAEKYSPPGTAIEIGCREADGRVGVFVLDRGIGVKPDEAELLFEPFYRSAAGVRAARGSGLGLTICRRIVEYLDGSIHAEPREGGGSRFHFAIPAAKAVAAPVRGYFEELVAEELAIAGGGS